MKIMSKYIASLLLALLISTPFLSGCLEMNDEWQSEPLSSRADPDSIANPTGEEQMAWESNLFALDMYRDLAASEGNLFFSPWSLSSALSMTYEGARGQTAEEMHTVLHLSGNESERRQSFSLLDQRINANDSGYILSTANALWVDEDYSLTAEYRDLVEETYHARSTNLNFQEESETARAVINSWVEERTQGKIIDLIPAGYIHSLTRLVLTNAIFFKGTWKSEFDRELTENEDFFTTEGQPVAVPMMRKIGEESGFLYQERGDLQVLQMPYQGENISLLILLPKKRDLVSLERSISAERLAQWRDGLQERQVDVYIPRFKFSAKYFLNENLASMGMPTVFSETADLSGLSARKGVFISDVIHQAYIDVNEEGTLAAAATAVCVAESAVPEEKIPVFRADHPFIFMITDDQTGLILFMGRFSDPEEG